MLFPLFEALQVQYDSRSHLMRFQWLNATPAPARPLLAMGAGPGPSLQPALVHGRDLVLAHQPTRVLLDFAGLPPISLTDELWISVHWLPQVVAPPLAHVALVLRREHLHNQMVTETLLWVGRHLLRQQIQVFEEVPAALDWLLDGDRAAALRLQGEWDAYVPPAPGLQARPGAAALPS